MPAARLLVSVFDAGGRGFVQQADDVEARHAEHFGGQEALIAISVGGNAQHVSSFSSGRHWRSGGRHLDQDAA